ncbi:uncharacterized protein LOC116415969 [Nasonia vitripennis]|uniref:Uncharacterized protein n=1 Tax=Nasonia vitripennis TaxID=7425 RepID=A0A7M7PWV4_NASVI|nr:uncharacterized protein LOC116415969 [Nasonia vitripennis]
MWKLEPAVIIFSALLCLIRCQVPQDYVDATSSVKSYTAKYNDSVPKIVTLKNRIYTVILDYHTINLTSIDSGSDQPQQLLSCKLLTSEAFTYSNLDNEVVGLDNGKIVLVTHVKNKPEESYRFHIILDPFDCSSQKIVKVPCQRSDADLLVLIPYQDTYDVIKNYIFSQKNDTIYPKNPQRFNDKGEQIELDYSLKPDPTSIETAGWFKHLFKINTIKPFDASKGYYCTYYTDGKGTVLQRLNSRFETVKEISFHNTNLHVSTTQGHINYCSFKENITCKLLNSDLEVHATSELPKLNSPKGVYLEDRQVINLPNHRGFVVLLGYKTEPVNSLKSVDFYLQRVETSGSALPYYWKIGKALLYHYDLYGIVDSERDFCYVILAVNWINGSNVDVHNRCLDLYAY